MAQNGCKSGVVRTLASFDKGISGNNDVDNPQHWSQSSHPEVVPHDIYPLGVVRALAAVARRQRLVRGEFVEFFEMGESPEIFGSHGGLWYLRCST